MEDHFSILFFLHVFEIFQEAKEKKKRGKGKRENNVGIKQRRLAAEKAREL